MTKQQWRLRDDSDPLRAERSGVQELPAQASTVYPRSYETVRDLDDPPDLIGQCIDNRYRIRGELGRGGMGIVYDAIHEDLKRAVALKVMHAPAAADDVAARFQREARIAAGFTHPSIVSIFDYGRLCDGRPYLVMPRLYGRTLTQLLQLQGTMRPAHVVALLWQVGAALDHVHAREFVHRDVKTDNVMLARTPGNSVRVVLLDFGIASALHGDEPRLTAQGQLCGTLDYMSPEASVGTAPSRSDDVYALATVAFELITGEVPFSTKHNVDTIALLSRKITMDPPSLSAVAGKPFSRALEAVLARGLAREQGQRFASAGAFVEALRAAAKDPPPLPARRPARKKRKRRIAVFARGLVVKVKRALRRL